jgi:hypothetical protein
MPLRCRVVAQVGTKEAATYYALAVSCREVLSFLCLDDELASCVAFKMLPTRASSWKRSVATLCRFATRQGQSADVRAGSSLTGTRPLHRRGPFIFARWLALVVGFATCMLRGLSHRVCHVVGCHRMLTEVVCSMLSSAHSCLSSIVLAELLTTPCLYLTHLYGMRARAL